MQTVPTLLINQFAAGMVARKEQRGGRFSPTPFAERARSSGAASASRPIGPPWRAGRCGRGSDCGRYRWNPPGERPLHAEVAFPQHVERRRAGECRGDLVPSPSMRACQASDNTTAYSEVDRRKRATSRLRPAAAGAQPVRPCARLARPAAAVRPFRQQRVLQLRAAVNHIGDHGPCGWAVKASDRPMRSSPAGPVALRPSSRESAIIQHHSARSGGTAPRPPGGRGERQMPAAQLIQRGNRRDRGAVVDQNAILPASPRPA